jgi:molybdate transport system substrate-binding protein
MRCLNINDAQVVATPGQSATAAEIKLLCAVALHPAIDALIPDLEKSSGHKVTVAYGTAGAVAERVQKGEAADIVISSVPMIDRLQAQGKVAAGDRVTFAKVGVGAFVRKGTAKPDISSADAFKRAMLAARSITYPDPASGGASAPFTIATRVVRSACASRVGRTTATNCLDGKVQTTWHPRSLRIRFTGGDP